MRRIFYFLKPILPRRFQLSLRKKIIEIKVEKYRNVWPILESSSKHPDNWKGWPDDNKFALVLTHDVEHKKGYDRVVALMEMEKELGFVSSFNFVPERDYVVDKSMLNMLKDNNFEYGVHGLYHDGKLFSSKEIFLKRAKRINRYLNDWNAVGFRAPAMHHNLDWIGELNIDYDLSTFDTDPFEPQPDGVGTIFPFWVLNNHHKRGGYVELPYTLPQDFTVFVLMQEKTPKIWKEKTDWIVKNGGMVLVNVHPDYINFSMNGKIKEEFSSAIYRDFLNYLNDSYKGKFWNPLPEQLANYYFENYL